MPWPLSAAWTLQPKSSSSFSMTWHRWIVLGITHTVALNRCRDARLFRTTRRQQCYGFISCRRALDARRFTAPRSGSVIRQVWCIDYHYRVPSPPAFHTVLVMSNLVGPTDQRLGGSRLSFGPRGCTDSLLLLHIAFSEKSGTIGHNVAVPRKTQLPWCFEAVLSCPRTRLPCL